MATVITRNVASTPQRAPGATWEVIVQILAPDSRSSARAELEKVAGVAAAAISSEAPKDDAFIVFGNGPQVRIYCAFGDDAITGDGINEDDMAEPPANGDWRMSIPCLEDDLVWIQNKLKSLSNRVTARVVGEVVEYEGTESVRASGGIALNIEEFLRS